VTKKSQTKTQPGKIAEKDLDKVEGGAIVSGSDRAFNPQPEPPAASQLSQKVSQTRR